ncbi:MAG: chorismate-binding protein, partial [Wenzhouxiangella sp.]
AGESDEAMAQALADINGLTPATQSPEFGNRLDLDLHADPGEQFMAGVERIKEWILDGDVFQVNLSRGWKGASTKVLDPAALYRSLSISNPAPFAGLARLPGGTVLSSSPERLVEIRADHVQTRPIAGTRPRGTSAEQDASLSAELMAHPKERAEHIMLIDLERNDLGRVCRKGSIEVNELMVVESYTHVHHIVSNVRGRLQPGIHATDVIAAVFPGGTITGCPKVRCMEIIATLEGQGRGFYTGAMGYLGHDGSMDTNILIRSMVVRDHELSFRTGAGIVADSDPEAELAETEAKARGLLRALRND